MVFKSFFAVVDCVITVSIKIKALFVLAKLAYKHGRYAITMPIIEVPFVNCLSEGKFSL